MKIGNTWRRNIQNYLAIGMLLVIAIQGAQGQIFNGSFENGLDSWGTSDLSNPFDPIAVNPEGTSPGFGLFANSPTDGLFALTHGFDGGGPGTIEFWQDVIVPQNNQLTFDWRAGWDFTLGVPATVRMLDLAVEPFGGGTPMQITNILTADVSTPVNLDTGVQQTTVDLAAFTLQPVRLNFISTIPENFSGPAHLMVDNVRSVPEPVTNPVLWSFAALLFALRTRRKAK